MIRCGRSVPTPTESADREGFAIAVENDAICPVSEPVEGRGTEQSIGEGVAASGKLEVVIRPPFLYRWFKRLKGTSISSRLC